jgi:hypothetical protein
MESIMAGSSEKLIQAQQEKASINELFANSIFSQTHINTNTNTNTYANSDESVGDSLAQLSQAKEEFIQYSESFDGNTDWRAARIILAVATSFALSLVLGLSVNKFLGFGCAVLSALQIPYYMLSHAHRGEYKFLTFFKKGKRIAGSIEHYKKKLLPIVSNKEFQFKILYQLQMLAKKIDYDATDVSQEWITDKHDQLIISFNSKNYDDSYSILAEIYQNHDLIHNQLLQKIDLRTYEEELREFVETQTSIDQALPFEHHVQQLKQLL